MSASGMNRPGYAAAQPWLLTAAVLLPALALVGFADGGREVRALAEADPGRIAALREAGNWPEPGERDAIYIWERAVLASQQGAGPFEKKAAALERKR